MATHSEESRPEPILVFAAYSRNPVGRPRPPGIKSTDRPGSYLGYFANEHGEKWVFEYDRQRQQGRLFGEDCGWREYQVIEGLTPDLSLDPNERDWLRACWGAATMNRQPSSNMR